MQLLAERHTGHTKRLDEDPEVLETNTIMMRRITDLTQGLLDIDSSLVGLSDEPERNDPDGAAMVQPLHQSLLDFLLEGHGFEILGGSDNALCAKPHEYVLEACMNTISLASSSEAVGEKREKSFGGFLSYARSRWFIHAGKSSYAAQEDAMNRFLANSERNLRFLKNGTFWGRDWLEDSGTLLHLVALFDLPHCA